MISASDGRPSASATHHALVCRIQDGKPPSKHPPRPPKPKAPHNGSTSNHKTDLVDDDVPDAIAEEAADVDLPTTTNHLSKMYALSV